MNQNNIIFILVSSVILLVSSIDVTYQIYKMTIIDAQARGLKHPKLWGFIATGGRNSSGLLLYLIGRRKYPIKSISETDRQEIETRKKTIGIALIFVAISTIGLVINIILL